MATNGLAIPTHFNCTTENGALFGLDINYSNWGGGALLDYEKSLFPGVPNSFTVDPYVTFPLVFGSGLQVYTTIALTRLSPNHEVGVRLVL